MWIVYAFGSAFFAGITAVLAKIGIKNINSHLATAIRTIIILIFSWIMVFIVKSFDTITSISFKTLLFLILSGIVTGLSWLCYFKALQLGNVNKVTAIDKSSTILTMILAIIFLKENITILKCISIILIGMGTLLMVENKEDHTQIQDQKWLFYALGSSLFASLTSILGKIGINGIESNLGTAIRTVVVFTLAWAIVFMKNKHKEIKNINKKTGIFLILSGLTTGLSWLCYYKALQTGEASIVVPIDKLSIVITIIFSSFILKEKLTTKSFVGFIEVIIGTLLLLV